MELVCVTLAVVIGCISRLSYVGAAIDINFQDQNDGYILKPHYHKNTNRSQLTYAQNFVVLNKRQDSHLLHAKFGPFEIYQNVPQVLLNAHDKEQSSRTHHSVINNMDLNVYIVDYPNGHPGGRLRVLFHISRSAQRPRRMLPYRYLQQGQLWCARVYLEQKDSRKFVLEKSVSFIFYVITFDFTDHGTYAAMFETEPYVGAAIDINFQDQNDGYILKPHYHKNTNRSQLTYAQNFVVLNKRQDSHLLHAKFGPFEIYQNVPQVLLNAHDKEQSSRTHHSVINNMDLNVYIVDYPNGHPGGRLRVLFHISRSAQRPRRMLPYRYLQQGQLWCARVYLEHHSRRLAAHCLLNDSSGFCVTSLVPPVEWWKDDKATIDVLYSVTQTDNGLACSSVPNTLIPNSHHGYIHNEATANFLEKITINNATESYTELRDHFVIINVPQQALTAGSKFFVPIKLEAGSDLKMFIIRVRARSGIQILGAEVVKGSNWDIFVDVNDRQRSATITANIRDLKNYGKHKKSEDVLRVKLEVEPGVTDGSKVSRVIWSVERGYNTRSRSRYFLPESKMVSRFRINFNNPEKVVAILTVSNLLNRAVLTGREERHRLYVYLIGDDARLRDITNRSMCYSSNNLVVKVSSDCRYVFVDGTETRGGYNVSIIAKYGGHTAFATLHVWVPERRLDIQLSDNKLSQVKRWRIPTHKSRRTSRHKPANGTPQCHIKYQESLLDVYTRFHIESRRMFYANRKAYMRITDLVRDRIRVADSHIAEIRAGVVYGKQPGRTEIQVLSPYGRVLGASELRVLRDRVAVARLSITLVTGISMDIVQSRSIAGAMEAIVRLDDTIRDTLQEGVLQAEVVYTDQKVVPLKVIDSSWYVLDLMPTYNHLLHISPGSQPRINGLASANGKLIKYVLHAPDSCRRKTARSLSAGTIDVNIRLRFDDDSPKKDVQSDAVYHRDADAKYESFRGNDILTVTLPDESHGIVDASSEMLTYDYGNRHELSIAVKKSLTPLEIGMYVLLAVFCIAIFVFLVHCGVFVFRNTQKHLPKQTSPIAANDWVWLGRATLERNSIMDTRCSQALMPEEDFNGNRISQVSPSFDIDSSRAGTSSASSSNRNSQISTYQGNECSIRITANPLEESSNREYQSEMSTGSSYLTPPPASASRRSYHFPDRDTLMSMSETDHEWDYEAMGMTYDQLVDYFGNLRETTA